MNHERHRSRNPRRGGARSSLERGARWAAAIALTLGLQTGWARRLDAQGDRTVPPAYEGTLIVTVSVDWEGYSLDRDDLRCFAGFRERFPAVPLTHFMNAVYYTRDEPAGIVTEWIRRVIRPEDEIGVHIHGWRSLVKAAGVRYRDRPRFWGPEAGRIEYGDDTGYDVELSAYSAEEIQKLAKTSRKILAKQGFQVSKSFRCGAWLASPSVLQGVRAAGFTVDSSATDRAWHRDEIEAQPLYESLGRIWPDVTEHTQPYRIRTPAGAVLEMPDTCALADYVTADEMNDHLKRALEKVTPETCRFTHIGFHQENCPHYLGRIMTCLEKWKAHPRVRFLTLEKAARVFHALPRVEKEND